ncbi:MAG: hypothetical protein AB7O97_17340 [Planctomycetota bacterium]
MFAATPENLALARSFGLVLLAVGGLGLGTGKAWFRELIQRDEDPRGFWTATCCTLALGAFCVVGSLVAR